MNRYYIVISGLVQEVGFRYFTYQAAVTLDLTGWVRNCDNGNVEIEVQGSEEVILKLIKKLKQGNGFSRVEEVSYNTIDIKKDEKSFKYIY